VRLPVVLAVGNLRQSPSALDKFVVCAAFALHSMLQSRMRICAFKTTLRSPRTAIERHRITYIAIDDGVAGKTTIEVHDRDLRDIVVESNSTGDA
jgi:hypothetical protein